MPTINVIRLLKLQEADLRLRDMKTRLTTLPQEMNNMLAKREKLNASTLAAQKKVKQLKQEQQNAENAITGFEDEISKLRQQSTMVKKNNEYQAMLAQIELIRNKIDREEEKGLELLDQIAAAETAAVKIKKLNDAEIKSLHAEFNELFEFSKEVKVEIAKLEAARPGLTHGVDTETLMDYEALLRSPKGGAPLVEVTNNTCGHCRLQVTAQTAVAVKRGEIARCDNCQYLLYDPKAE